MRNHQILGFVIISISLWKSMNCQGQPRRQLQFTNAVNCNIKGLKLLVENLYTQYYPPKYFLNGHYRVIDDINELKTLVINIEKCPDQVNVCEHFQNVKIEHCCRMMTSKNQIWSDFMDHFHPPFRCPLKKAKYEVQNVTVDSETLIRWFPDLDKSRWKFTFKVTNERDSVVSCVIFDVYVQQFGKQDRKVTKKPKNNRDHINQWFNTDQVPYFT